MLLAVSRPLGAHEIAYPAMSALLQKADIRCNAHFASSLPIKGGKHSCKRGPPTAAPFKWLIGIYAHISLREFCGTELCIVMHSPANCNERPLAGVN